MYLSLISRSSVQLHVFCCGSSSLSRVHNNIVCVCVCSMVERKLGQLEKAFINQKCAAGFFRIFPCHSHLNSTNYTYFACFLSFFSSGFASFVSYAFFHHFVCVCVLFSLHGLFIFIFTLPTGVCRLFCYIPSCCYRSVFQFFSLSVCLFVCVSVRSVLQFCLNSLK